MAEKAGFEPAVGYKPTHAFQACDLNHSSTSPDKRAIIYRALKLIGGLFSFWHTANDMAEASVNVSDFTRDTTGQIRHHESCSITHVINRHIAT